MSGDSYVLLIEWDEGVNLPSLVGPFEDPLEAQEWARLNIPNGSWNVAPLAYPYMRPGDTSGVLFEGREPSE
jgi:hypothetical protein